MNIVNDMMETALCRQFESLELEEPLRNDLGV